jgi:deoxyribonuclease-4
VILALTGRKRLHYIHTQLWLHSAVGIPWTAREKVLTLFAERGEQAGPSGTDQIFAARSMVHSSVFGKGMKEFSIRIGVHVSIAGGIEKSVARAQALGCSTMQIFARNPRGWKASPLPQRSIAAFREAIAASQIAPVVIHTPYLLNLASGDGVLHGRSVLALSEDVNRAKALGASFVVTHLGSSRGRNGVWGRRQIVKGLKTVMKQEGPVTILLENSAGGGDSVGSSWEELAEILLAVGFEDRLGVCFDSCHGYAAGYDFGSPAKAERLVRRIDQTIGLRRLALLHLNDCAGPFGGHLDRHQHIGKGHIGIHGFRSLVAHPALQQLPMILETPKKHPLDDWRNLNRIRTLLPEKAAKADGPGRPRTLPLQGETSGRRKYPQNRE